MINYDIGDSITKYYSLLMHIVIYFLLVVGLFVSVKVAKPKYLGWGRVFMGALIWFGTHIALSLIFFKMPIVVTITAPIAWYFETKFLWEYDWVKAFLPWIITIAVVVLGILAFHFAAPEFLKTALGIKLF
jgi:hypothetical protein